MTRIVCISDTHDRLADVEVPDGDILIHAGDFTKRGLRADVERFAADLNRLPHRHKVIIAGNHDFLFEAEPKAARALLGDVDFLEDSGCEIAGLKFWGSPWQPEFFDWAFNLPRGAPLRQIWDLIPNDTDVLVTHGPPHGILDRVYDGTRAGCEELLIAIERVRPKLHVFGHIHEAYGQVERQGTIHVNASSCDLNYRPNQAPIVIDLGGGI